MAKTPQRLRATPPDGGDGDWGMDGMTQKAIRRLVLGMLAMGEGGCALGSGIVPIGPDTYVLSEMRAPVRGGGAEAQRVVLAEASGFCQQQGREVILLDLRPDGDPRTRYWPTAFDATFRCSAVDGGSPAAGIGVPPG